MRFRTEIEIPQFERKIEPGDRIFSIGSCFAENIASKLCAGGFQVASNPFGVLYNPASIEMALKHIYSGREYTEEDLVRNGELWCSPYFHSTFPALNPGEALEKMNRAVHTAHKALAQADHVLISFGTPWAYTVSGKFTAHHPSLAEGAVVANCHKFPPDYYERRRMTAVEISGIYSALADGPLQGKKVIYTVSPVRYVKEGLHGSNLGKAVLLLAVEDICRTNSGALYFPAYEALTDDLRDYRFYDTDLVHPSQSAVEYIWELFRTHAMTTEAADQAVETARLTATMRHRVFHPGGGEYLRWRESMRRKIADLRKRFPKAEISLLEEYFNEKGGECGINGVVGE